MLGKYSLHFVHDSSISMEKMEKTTKNRYKHLDCVKKGVK